MNELALPPLQQWAGWLAGMVSLIAYVPYIASILRRETYPNRTSWAIWFLVSLLSALSYQDLGARFAFLVPSAYTVGCFAIAMLSLRLGTGGWTRLDRICMLGAASGLALWIVFDTALAALLVMLLLEVLGTLPTLRKSYYLPQTENRLAWFLFSAGTLINLFAIESWSFAQAVYPVAMVFIIGAVSVVVLWPSHKHCGMVKTQYR